jgi:hypothetical protein
LQIRRSAPFKGVMSASNSLTGTGDINEYIGENITVLENGNYVVCSEQWNAGRGAATWVNASAPRAGQTISASNSLVGNSGGDRVCSSVITLKGNSNYVVVSIQVGGTSLATGPMCGAVTWGNGSAGTFGAVSLTNSFFSGSSGVSDFTVTPLPVNGNFVVAIGYASVIGAEAGAAHPVVWMNGRSGMVGYPTASNAQYDTSGLISTCGEAAKVTALSNGNYVITRCSQEINGYRGVVSWGNGELGGRVGNVLSDRLIAGFSLGSETYVVPLTNGNYVISSYANSSGAGTITFGNGKESIGTVPSRTEVTTVSDGNSLVGSKVGERLGGLHNWVEKGVVALSNGNYVAGSVDGPAGTASGGGITWGDGTRGTVGLTSALNTVYGPSCCYRVFGITPFSDGRFVVSEDQRIGDSTNGPSYCEYDGRGPISGGRTEMYCVFTDAGNNIVPGFPVAHSESANVWS